MKVLILGNGISRLQYTEEIRDWDGEIWVSNYAFVEFGNRCARVNGHPEVLDQAELWRELHGYTYHVTQIDEYPDLPVSLRGNSGIYLVAQALEDGYTDINLCGFDFGGKDVWTPWMERRAVEAGMQRKWKSLLQRFQDARERITFWKIKPGYNELFDNFESIFCLARKEYENLLEEIATLRKLAGVEIIAPEAMQVTEQNRSDEYYDKIMKLFEV